MPRSVSRNLLLGPVFALACSDADAIPDGHFPCGAAGSCERGTQVCVEADGCTTCFEAATCEDDDPCSCLAASSDPTVAQCAQSGSCTAAGEDLQLVCDSGEDPPFGCG
jgi:hypothetical protein